MGTKKQPDIQAVIRAAFKAGKAEECFYYQECVGTCAAFASYEDFADSWAWELWITKDSTQKGIAAIEKDMRRSHPFIRPVTRRELPPPLPKPAPRNMGVTLYTCDRFGNRIPPTTI